MHSFLVHSNESPCRKGDFLGWTKYINDLCIYILSLAFSLLSLYILSLPLLTPICSTLTVLSLLIHYTFLALL